MSQTVHRGDVVVMII